MGGPAGDTAGATGMRAARIDRVKRRVLREAVAENLDIIRGVPPRAVHTRPRLIRRWLQRAAVVALPVIFAGFAWMLSTNGSVAAPAVRQAVATVIPAAPAPRPVVYDLPPAPPGAERVTASAFPLAVRRVVLDAGHGGSDPGASAKALLEKTITLDINHRLRALLERDGFQVVVTRADDTTVALKERARLANDSDSDIFVSIHVNALAQHTASRGIETYYLGATNDPSLTALAAAENRVSGYSMADMRKLLEGVYADARSDESHSLARALQQNLFSNLQKTDTALENWGVKRAPFVVLVATDMPAVLAEVGCLSNPHDAAMLQRPEYRQKIAEALFDGIRSYAGAGDAPQKKGMERNG
jgi:N-acetylmuramoyl-L-alanine amidase